MKDQKFNLRRFLSLGLLTFFGSGYFPKIPGTIGSIATIPLILLIATNSFSFYQVLTFTVFLFIISCWIADIIQIEDRIHDPGWIVIDEVIGMLITWLFVFPSTNPIDLMLVLIIFRVFDIIKIYPASWFDKSMTNGMGTIIDDVISAIYAGLTIILIKYLVTII